MPTCIIDFFSFPANATFNMGFLNHLNMEGVRLHSLELCDPRPYYHDRFWCMVWVCGFGGLFRSMVWARGLFMRVVWSSRVFLIEPVTG